jgi:hypothetical protein
VNARDFLLPSLALTACLVLACGDDTDPLTPTTTTASASDPTAASNASNASSSSDGTGGTGDAGGTTDATGTGGVDTTAPTSGDPTTGATATTSGDTTGTATTEPAPTDGPGVLPGEDGMDAFCRRYKECGGTYYEDQQACLDATYDYWGDCPSRKAALDAFGACMSEIDCDDWSPDAYNPSSTPCAAEWDQVGASEPCS